MAGTGTGSPPTPTTRARSFSQRKSDAALQQPGPDGSLDPANSYTTLSLRGSHHCHKKRSHPDTTAHSRAMSRVVAFYLSTVEIGPEGRAKLRNLTAQAQNPRM